MVCEIFFFICEKRENELKKQQLNFFKMFQNSLILELYNRNTLKKYQNSTENSSNWKMQIFVKEKTISFNEALH